MKPRGLAFNEDKIQIVHLTQGCDFLGFNIRRYGSKLLIKPSAEAGESGDDCAPRSVSVTAAARLR